MNLQCNLAKPGPSLVSARSPQPPGVLLQKIKAGLNGGPWPLSNGGGLCSPSPFMHQATLSLPAIARANDSKKPSLPSDFRRAFGERFSELSLARTVNFKTPNSDTYFPLPAAFLTPCGGHYPLD
ncbi:hypothetical protein SRHO_G00126650 [Serrasalmus rhombeus]